MTKYAAEDILHIRVRFSNENTSGTELLPLTPAQRAAVAVALERPEEVVRAIKLLAEFDGSVETP